MDTQPKRRVLSLSLSQPSKQNKKLKLKRHASSNSKNDSSIPPDEGSMPTNSIRDDVKVNVPLSSPISSNPTDLPAVGASVFDKSSSVSPKGIAGQEREPSEKKTADVSEGNFEEGHAAAHSTEEIQTSNFKSAAEVRGEFKGSPQIKEEPVLENPVCCRKVTETTPLKDHSLNSPTAVPEDDTGALNVKRVERRQNSLKTNEAVNSSPTSSNLPANQAQTKFLEEKIPSPNRCTASSSVNQPSVDAVLPSKMSEKNSTSDTVATNTQECLDVLQCPLCSKSFEKLASKTSHLKSCASKHKVSTQRLLEVLELQRRQAAERKALGLPGIPQVLEKSKKPPSKKVQENRATSKIDSNLQLALALSLSLQDQEQTIESSKSSETANSVSLDHFGFTSKSVLESIQPRLPTASIPRGKTKGKKKSTPALLTRTAEERQQIITEKVAMVLLEEVDLEKDDKNPHLVNVKSSYLQDCLDEESALWAKSHTSPSKNDRASFYVQDLRGFISPSKVEMGSKVLHLSQIAGRVKTPTKVREQKDNETPPSDEDISSDSSFHQQDKLTDPSHIEMELRAKLFNDWASMVNNSTMSDLAIYPQEGRDIPAHKIVLHVRCPRILQDVCRQRNPLTGNEVEVIMWSQTPHVAALAFLEYVYCGSVKSIRVLSEDLSSIFWLANHYKVADLIRYLSAVSKSSQTSEISSQVALSIIRDTNEQGAEPQICQDRKKNCNKTGMEREASIAKESSLLCTHRQSNALVDIFASPAVTPQSETESIYSELTVAGAENRGSCSSPDMFCDDDIVKSTLANPVCLSQRLELQDPIDRSSRGNQTGDCPPSRSASVSSDKTVIVENNSRPVSRCGSVSSEKTILLGNNSPIRSPGPPETITITEMLDFNESGSKRPTSSLNDSKRKHSDSSQDGDVSYSKRPCPISSTPGQQSEKIDSDVELCDLTQDSNSNPSLPAVTKDFSEDSCDKICISSETEDSDVHENNKIPSDKSILSKSDAVDKSNTSDGFDQINKSNEAARDSSPPKNVQPYVSPVWDGFEDLNYEDPFFTEVAVNSDSPPRVTGPSASAEISTISLSKSPGALNKESSQQECNTAGSGSSSDCEMTYQSPAVSLKKSSPQTSSCFDALLDDSLHINESVLQQAESCMHDKLTQRNTKGTPVNRLLSSEPDKVTPLANYSAMKTPELKRELQKYGLKPTLGKRKGKLMLRHIYNELHPWVPTESESLLGRVSLSQPSSSSSDCAKDIPSSSQLNSRKLSFSQSDPVEEDTDCLETKLQSSDSDSDASSDDNRSMSIQEIQYLEGNEDIMEPKSQTSSKFSKADLPNIVSHFIRNDNELHQKVLEYEPILIEKLQSDLRNNGFKFKMADLMAFLDEKCVTFRSAPSGPRVKRRKPREAELVKKTTTKKINTNTNYLSD